MLLPPRTHGWLRNHLYPRWLDLILLWQCWTLDWRNPRLNSNTNRSCSWQLLNTTMLPQTTSFVIPNLLLETGAIWKKALLPCETSLLPLMSTLARFFGIRLMPRLFVALLLSPSVLSLNRLNKLPPTTARPVDMAIAPYKLISLLPFSSLPMNKKYGDFETPTQTHLTPSSLSLRICFPISYWGPDSWNPTFSPSLRDLHGATVDRLGLHPHAWHFLCFISCAFHPSRLPMHRRCRLDRPPTLHPLQYFSFVLKQLLLIMLCGVLLFVLPYIFLPIGWLRVMFVCVKILWWEDWAVVFDDWLNHLGGIDERPWVGIAVFDLVFFFLKLVFWFLALRWFLIIPLSYFLAPIFSFELFGLKVFFSFGFCLKTLFPHIHSPRYIIFLHFLIRIYTCGGFPRLGPLRWPLWEFFAFSGFLEFGFLFFLVHFIFVNSSRAHIGFGNCGFLFSFTPCLLSFLPCFALFVLLFALLFFRFYSNHEGNEVTMSTPLRSYEVTKLNDVMSKAIFFYLSIFHSCLLTWTQFFLALFLFCFDFFIRLMR